MHCRTGRAVLAGTLAALAAAVVACAAGGPGQGSTQDRPVGLAAIAGSGESSLSGTPTSTPSPIQVTVPELTVAGTIANLMAPVVTVPPTTTAPAAPTEPAAPEPAAPPSAEAPAPAPEAAPPAAPTTVVPPYTTVLGWTGEGKVAYLTFDDGPGPATGQMLDILAAKGVKATFCVVGQRVAGNSEMTRRIVAEGHTLCNHSWDHPTAFNTLPADVLAGQIGRTQDAIVQATGHTPRYLRAPEGRFGDPAGSVHQAAQQARTLLLGWAVDSKDWTKPGATTIISNVVGAVSPGAIILLHDAGGADRRETLDALPGVIDGLQAAGYTLLPLPPDPAG
ncbi:MAG TPA: polysaccharide deacetylase family protein [Nakamurella sp.]|jgi:peptidoglycan/xylan/chitin deacetylase (PgdA/CDA1 family)